MKVEERERLRSWIRGWADVDAVQYGLRRKKLQSIKTSDSIAALNMAFQAARIRMRKRSTSGLTEFHRILKNCK